MAGEVHSRERPDVGKPSICVKHYGLRMRTKSISLLAASALLIGAGLAVAPTATADEDVADQSDFLSAAAEVADITVYAPTRKGLRRAGLMTEGTPPLGSSLQMLCPGEWNVQVSFDGTSGFPDSGATVYQAPSLACMPDFGAGDAPASRWKFQAAGKTFRVTYEGCSTTSEGAQDPAIGDCAVSDRFQNVFGRLPASGGMSSTRIHIETTGMTRAQIRALVRSMEPVG